MKYMQFCCKENESEIMYILYICILYLAMCSQLVLNMEMDLRIAFSIMYFLCVERLDDSSDTRNHCCWMDKRPLRM